MRKLLRLILIIAAIHNLFSATVQPFAMPLSTDQKRCRYQEKLIPASLCSESYRSISMITLRICFAQD